MSISSALGSGAMSRLPAELSVLSLARDGRRPSAPSLRLRLALTGQVPVGTPDLASWMPVVWGAEGL